MKWAPRQPKVGGVGAHDGRAIAETGAQRFRTSVVEFDGDHPDVAAQQRCGDHPVACADVENGRTGIEVGEFDELFSPRWIELVPAPLPPWGG